MNYPSGPIENWSDYTYVAIPYQDGFIDFKRMIVEPQGPFGDTCNHKTYTINLFNDTIHIDFEDTNLE